MKLTAFDRISIAVASVSTATLLLEVTWPFELEAPANLEEATDSIEPTPVDAAAIGPLSEYLSVSERPLFTPDRRPFVMVVEAAPEAAGPRVEFELTAVIITGTTQLALLRSNLTPTVRRVALNEAIDGWTLAAVTPGSVALTQGETTVTVPLRPDLGGARSGQAVRIDKTAASN